MSIKRPYYRIFRPQEKSDFLTTDYVLHKKNILNWSSPLRAFHLIVSDFRKICEYIDPCDCNLATYSHRIYELFIRTCTEIESNFKSILKANGYSSKKNGKIKKDNDWNIEDYKKLEAILKLSDYKVLINFWDNGRGRVVAPYQNWAKGKSGKLVWYSFYNEVKHNREDSFYLASIENLIYAICGLFVILFSQYSVQVFSPYQIIDSYNSFDNNLGRFICGESDFIFAIFLPKWGKSEKYDFNWESLCESDDDPFEQFFKK